MPPIKIPIPAIRIKRVVKVLAYLSKNSRSFGLFYSVYFLTKIKITKEITAKKAACSAEAK